MAIKMAIISSQHKPIQAVENKRPDRNILVKLGVVDTRDVKPSRVYPADAADRA